MLTTIYFLEKNNIPFYVGKTVGSWRNNKISKKLSKPVIQYDLNGNFIKEWSSITKARLKTNINKIDKVARGEGKTAGGFKWEYVK
jgi:hypothetical protein